MSKRKEAMQRKGRKMQVIKNHKVIAICENAGEAMRLTKIHRNTICKRLKDGAAVREYRFVEVPR